jgi:Tol biopolymer transport system component
MINRRLATLFLAALTFLSLTRADESKAGAGRDYVHPIVYVRDDGVYITDAQATTPDPVIRGVDTTFSRARWSPDGSQFVFSEHIRLETGESTLRLLHVTEAESPVPLPVDLSGASLPIYSGLLPTAWFPDSTQIAYFDGRDVNLFTPVDGTLSKRYAPKFGYSIGEAGGEGRSRVEHLVDEEREVTYLSTSVYLLGGAEGFIVGAQEGNFGNWYMVSWDRRVMWNTYFASVPLLSPDGLTALLLYEYLEGYDGQQTPVVFDLDTQEAAPLPVLENATLLGWSADGESVYFSTSADNMLTLWRLPVDAEDKTEVVKVFQMPGYAFGVMTVGEPGTPLVFSVITAADMSDRDSTFTELVAVDEATGALLWRMPGGRPSYGKGTFMAVVSD